MTEEEIAKHTADVERLQGLGIDTGETPEEAAKRIWPENKK